MTVGATELSSAISNRPMQLSADEENRSSNSNPNSTVTSSHSILPTSVTPPKSIPVQDLSLSQIWSQHRPIVLLLFTSILFFFLFLASSKPSSNLEIQAFQEWKLQQLENHRLRTHAAASLEEETLRELAQLEDRAITSGAIFPAREARTYQKMYDALLEVKKRRAVNNDDDDDHHTHLLHDHDDDPDPSLSRRSRRSVSPASSSSRSSDVHPSDLLARHERELTKLQKLLEDSSRRTGIPYTSVMDLQKMNQHHQEDGDEHDEEAQAQQRRRRQKRQRQRQRQDEEEHDPTHANPPSPRLRSSEEIIDDAAEFIIHHPIGQLDLSAAPRQEVAPMFHDEEDHHLLLSHDDDLVPGGSATPADDDLDLSHLLHAPVTYKPGQDLAPGLRKPGKLAPLDPGVQIEPEVQTEGQTEETKVNDKTRNTQLTVEVDMETDTAIPSTPTPSTPAAPTPTPTSPFTRSSEPNVQPTPAAASRAAATPPAAIVSEPQPSASSSPAGAGAQPSPKAPTPTNVPPPPPTTPLPTPTPNSKPAPSKILPPRRPTPTNKPLTAPPATPTATKAP